MRVILLKGTFCPVCALLILSFPCSQEDPHEAKASCKMGYLFTSETVDVDNALDFHKPVCESSQGLHIPSTPSLSFQASDHTSSTLLNPWLLLSNTQRMMVHSQNHNNDDSLQ